MERKTVFTPQTSTCNLAIDRCSILCIKNGSHLTIALNSSHHTLPSCGFLDKVWITDHQNSTAFIVFFKKRRLALFGTPIHCSSSSILPSRVCGDCVTLIHKENNHLGGTSSYVYWPVMNWQELQQHHNFPFSPLYLCQPIWSKCPYLYINAW